MLMVFNISPNTVKFPYLHICRQTPTNTSNLWQLLGRGVFATKEFQQGDFLLTYNGKLMRRKDVNEKQITQLRRAASFSSSITKARTCGKKTSIYHHNLIQLG